MSFDLTMKALDNISNVVLNSGYIVDDEDNIRAKALVFMLVAADVAPADPAQAFRRDQLKVELLYQFMNDLVHTWHSKEVTLTKRQFLVLVSDAVTAAIDQGISGRTDLDPTALLKVRLACRGCAKADSQEQLRQL